MKKNHTPTQSIWIKHGCSNEQRRLHISGDLFVLTIWEQYGSFCVQHGSRLLWVRYVFVLILIRDLMHVWNRRKSLKMLRSRENAFGSQFANQLKQDVIAWTPITGALWGTRCSSWNHKYTRYGPATMKHIIKIIIQRLLMQYQMDELHLFNDGARLSGKNSRPTQVNVNMRSTHNTINGKHFVRKEVWLSSLGIVGSHSSVG